MRVGHNPVKNWYPAYAPSRVGVASVTFVPMDAGYFKQALKVIEFHLRSIRASVDENVDLLVFDNGSCEQTTRFLTAQWQAGLIDTLILSKHNLGKTGALNWILSALPNEMICYSDSDVLFRPGWLEASLAVMEAFPKPGIITAQPNFHDILAGEGRAHLVLQSMSVSNLANIRQHLRSLTSIAWVSALLTSWRLALLGSLYRR